MTWSQGGGGRCCDLVPGGRGRGVGGRCCCPEGGRWLTIGVVHLPPFGVEVTHACEIITFARCTTRAVIIQKTKCNAAIPPIHKLSIHTNSINIPKK